MSCSMANTDHSFSGHQILLTPHKSIVSQASPYSPHILLLHNFNPPQLHNSSNVEGRGWLVRLVYAWRQCCLRVNTHFSLCSNTFTALQCPSHFSHPCLLVFLPRVAEVRLYQMVEELSVPMLCCQEHTVGAARLCK